MAERQMCHSTGCDERDQARRPASGNARDARGALAATNLPPQSDHDWTGVLPNESDDATRNVVTEVSPGRFHVRQAPNDTWRNYEVKPSDDASSQTVISEALSSQRPVDDAPPSGSSPMGQP